MALVTDGAREIVLTTRHPSERFTPGPSPHETPPFSPGRGTFPTTAIPAENRLRFKTQLSPAEYKKELPDDWQVCGRNTSEIALSLFTGKQVLLHPILPNGQPVHSLYETDTKKYPP